ncbi:uncharacterized protein [Amphiura filiformis]|uniref:uncharacterized protein isoform X2 n=1 Tax=Amphiura filiformis TaxID=82378 RepID=UPI003B21ED61
MNNFVIIAALVFLLHQQFVASQGLCSSSRPCENGGTCSGGTCTCPPRITGPFCNRIDTCFPNPCGINGGNCETRGNEAICTCLNGYSGLLCQIAPTDIGIECPGQVTVGADGVYTIEEPMNFFSIRMDERVKIIGYSYLSTERDTYVSYDIDDAIHTITMLPTDRPTQVEVSITNTIESATCTFSVGPAVITCPQNSTGLSAEYAFDQPIVMNFGDRDSITFMYTYNGIMETYLYTQQRHVLTNVPFGCSDIRVYAADRSGNDDSCVFQRCRAVVRCPMDVIESTCDPRYSVSFFPAATMTPDSATVPIGMISTTYTVSVGLINFNTANQDRVMAFFPLGSWTVTATATDNDGRMDSCEFNVMINSVDDTPRIQCPDDQSGTICEGQCLIGMSWPEADVAYNCVDMDNTNRIEYVGSGATYFPSQFNRMADMYAGMTTIKASLNNTRGQMTSCEFSIVVKSMDPCETHRCQNGGQCEVFPKSCFYSCVCPPCYYGQFCEKRVDACSCHMCQNGAMCQANSCAQYQCMCVGCYTGQFCQEPLPNPCLNNPCAGGYRCTRDPGSCTGYSCECIPGINCPTASLVYDKFCNTFPCQNGATCIDLESKRYLCICPPGYSGVNCAIATNVATSPCNNRPCNFFGECFTSNDLDNFDGLSEYTCVCENGYGGRNCISNVANNPVLDMCTTGLTCRNGGTCTNAYFSYADRNTGICSCPRGFFGRECQLTIEDPCMSNPCQNAGTCISFNTYFLCTCSAEYTGVICEVNPCQNRPCRNGGTCISTGISNYICSCTSQYTGPTCEISTQVNPCQSRPCQNGGTCTSAGANYICACTSQYTGPTCEISTQVNPCQSRPCRNGGTCISTGISNYICACTSLYTGPTCEISTQGPLRLICPTNQAETAQPGQTGTTVSYREGLVMGGSPPYNIDYNGNPSGNYFPIGVTLVRVTASDINNSMGSCTFTITVTSSPDINRCINNPCRNGGTCINGGNQFSCLCVAGYTGSTCQIRQPAGDTQPPWPVCPANYVAPIDDDGSNYITVDFPRAVATDNIGIAGPIEYSIPPGSFFPIGTTVVTATATDLAGNSAMCVFAVTVNVEGRRVPTVSGCNSDSSQLTVDRHTVIPPGQVTARLNWVEPRSSPAGIPGTIATRNGLRSGSQFPTGLTEIIYVFGSPGAEATCTYRVFVLESDQQPCQSNPCTNGMMCFQIGVNYLCNDQGRKKRDTEDKPHCGPYCDLLGGICADTNDLGDTFEPACFYPASAFTEDKHHEHSDPGSGEVMIEHHEHSEPGSGEVDYSQSYYGYLFLYILLTIICLVVCIQSFVVCRLVTKRIGGKFKSEKAVDEKDFY